MSGGWEERIEALAGRAGLRTLPPGAARAVAVLGVVVLLLAAWRWWPRSGGGDVFVAGAVAEGSADAGVPEGGARSAPASGAAELVEGSRGATVSAEITVHVVGAVRRPGVYRLPPGSRGADGLDAAGGTLGNAAPEAVNLARPLTDGEQLVVPTRDEVARGGTPGAGVTGKGGAATPGPGQEAAAGTPGSPVNVNTADAAALDTLPGVGPATAARIIAEREANGPFASAEDLGRVSGLGPKRLAQLDGLVSVR